MKPLKLSIILLTVALIFNSCDPKQNCNVTGTTVNIGSTTGGNYGVTVYHDPVSGKNYDLAFNNTNLNFYIDVTITFIKGQTLDLGDETCLDYSTSTTPSAIYVAYAKGHGYYAKYDDGHTLKFIANWYSDGIVNVTYIFE